MSVDNNIDKLDHVDWDSFNTGDVILFHGECYWFSYLIESFTWSEFSHIGMILRDPIYIDSKLKGLYLLEAGAEKFPDAVEHKIEFGVQIVDLKKVVNNYTGKIYVRRLKVCNEIRSNLEITLSRVWKEIKNLPYDDNPWDLLKAAFRLNWGDNDRINDFFCSSLMTFLLDQAVFFNQKLEWDLVQPKDYDNGGKIETLLIDDVNMEPKDLIWNNSSWWNMFHF